MWLLYSIFTLWLCLQPVYSQALFLTPEKPLEFLEKKRITEILNRENYGMIEPFFYVSNRPTIQEALADEIKNRTLVSPINYMVYCPNGQDYFTGDSLNTGTIYISSENLPKNGQETNLWFNEAYQYRKESDAIHKPANVAVISAKRQNYLRVKCPNVHNHIIVASAPAPAPITYESPQLNIDSVKNLRYGDNPNISWNTNEYTLPSNIEQEYIDTEMKDTGGLKTQEINPPVIYLEIARKIASEKGVLLKFILAVAEVSSNYNQNKIAEQGKKLGIMQLSTNIATFYKIDKEEFFNPEQSFKIFCDYIQELHKEYNGDIDRILQAYYIGLKPAQVSEDIPDIPEAKIFTANVKRRIDDKQPIVF